MITVSMLFAVISGIAANQLDGPLSRINQRGWELIARYIVGITAGFAPFVMLVNALGGKAARDAVLAYAGAFAGVGLGVAMSRAIKDLAE